jgi:prophage regulatory protein
METKEKPPNWNRVQRAREVQRLTGLSRSTLWRLEKDGDFPKRLKLGPGAVGWLESEVLEWLSTRKRMETT